MARFIQSSSPTQGTTTRLRADQARDAIRKMLQEHDPLQLPVYNLTCVGVQKDASNQEKNGVSLAEAAHHQPAQGE